jgi:hypothetical protein
VAEQAECEREGGRAEQRRGDEDADVCAVEAVGGERAREENARCAIAEAAEGARGDESTRRAYENRSP